MRNTFRICLDARLVDGQSAGVQHVIAGLASGLSKLTDGPEEYMFLAYAGQHDWLHPYIDGPCKILEAVAPLVVNNSTWKEKIKVAVPPIHKLWRKIKNQTELRKMTLPKSDGTIEKSGIEIMHFTKQDSFATNVNSIYHPHDLQHLHLPQFFSDYTRKIREFRLRALCQQARMVAVASSWVKEDIVTQYGIPDEKVRVVPLAPIITSSAFISAEYMVETKIKFGLPEEFIFYPAQTYKHKNHIGLLIALAILRDRYGLTIPLVSTGQITEFFPIIELKVRELNLSRDVHFLGYITPSELRAVFSLSRGVVIPTLFEAASFPLWEAFQSGVPAACSSITSLPRQALDSALLFDPNKPEKIAEAIDRLWNDNALRKQLVESGRKNVDRFSWEITSRTFRAHYRRLADRELTEEDKGLLCSAPII